MSKNDKPFKVTIDPDLIPHVKERANGLGVSVEVMVNSILGADRSKVFASLSAPAPKQEAA